MTRETHRQDEWGQLEQIDAIVKRFEEAWRLGKSPNVADFLEGHEACGVALLVELIHSDLEFKIRDGSSIRTEDYLDAYPALWEHVEAVADLAWTEYRLRNAKSPSLSIGDMLKDQPHLRSIFAKRNVALGSTGTIDCRLANSTESIPPESDTETFDTRKLPNIPGYQLGELLGLGGMGIVYRATDLRLNRDVAIKFSLGRSYVNADEQSQFKREARAAAALRHPQIIQIYEFGCYEGYWYLILEYATGGNLAGFLNRLAIDPRKAAELVSGLANAVEVAHQRKIFHRDLKPANILLCEHGIAKIGDFGLAKQVSQQQSVTPHELVLATPSYAAPELIFGCKGDQLHYCDIYSLGAILYESITGRPPYVGNSVLDIVEQLRTSDPIRPRLLNRSIPLDLENICLRCLEYDPKRRYGTARELAEDLDRFLRDEPVFARSVSRLTVMYRWTRRNRYLTFALVASLIILMASVSVITFAALELAESNAREQEAIAREQAALDNAELIDLEREREFDAWRALSERGLQELNVLVMRPNINSPVPQQGLQERRIAAQRELDHTMTLEDLSPRVRGSRFTALTNTFLGLGLLAQARECASAAVASFESNSELKTRYPLDFAQALIALGRSENEAKVYEASEARFNLAASVLREAKLDESVAFANLAIARAKLLISAKKFDDLRKNIESIERAMTLIETSSNSNDRLEPELLLDQLVVITARAIVNQNASEALALKEKIWREIEDRDDLVFVKLVVANDIAVIYQNIQNHQQADLWIDRAISLCKICFGNDEHVMQSDVCSDAAWIKHSRGQQKRALELYRDAYLIRSRATGLDMETRKCRSEYFTRLLRYDRGSEVYRLASAIGKDSTFDWHDVWMLKSAYSASMLVGDLESAEKWSSLVVESTKESRSAEDWDQTMVMRAEIDCSRGDFAKAASDFNSWLESHGYGRRDFGLGESVDVSFKKRLRAWKSVGDQLGWLGRPDLVEIAGGNFEALIPNHFPKFHVDEWHLLCDQIDTLGRNPKFLELLELWRSSKPVSVHAHHPCEGMIHCSFARQLLFAGKPEEAKVETEISVNILESSLGTDHDLTLDAMQSLCEIMIHLGEAELADELAQKLFATIAETRGEGTPQEALWNTRLAICCFQQDKGTERLVICRQSFQNCLKRLGAYSPITLECLGGLCVALAAQGEGEEAKRLLSDHLEIISEKCHPNNLWMNWLVGLRDKIESGNAKLPVTEPLAATLKISKNENHYLTFLLTYWNPLDWRIRILR